MRPQALFSAPNLLGRHSVEPRRFGAHAEALSLNTYDEYGIPGSTNAGRFQYTGQAWLPELALYHYKARTYAPRLGRFLQTDPILHGGGMNLYAYVGNDPLNGVDPTGLCGATIDTWQWTVTNPDGTSSTYYTERLGFQRCDLDEWGVGGYGWGGLGGSFGEPGGLEWLIDLSWLEGEGDLLQGASIYSIPFMNPAVSRALCPGGGRCEILVDRAFLDRSMRGRHAVPPGLGLNGLYRRPIGVLAPHISGTETGVIYATHDVLQTGLPYLDRLGRWHILAAYPGSGLLYYNDVIHGPMSRVSNRLELRVVAVGPNTYRADSLYPRF